jgi:hypothetical protein
VGASLADSRKALLQYCSGMDSLCPVGERKVRVPEDNRLETTAGGVYANIKDSVHLFIPGSASRRIPFKEWWIPLPYRAEPDGYAFYPAANVIVFVGLSDEMQWVHWPSE